MWKFFITHDDDPEITQMLHSREMSIQHLLNKFRFVVISVIFAANLVFCFYPVAVPLSQVYFTVGFYIAILPLFCAFHVLTNGKHYHSWIKYVTITADLAGTYFFSWMIMTRFNNSFSLSPLSFIQVLSIIYILFTLISVLNASPANVVYATCLSILVNIMQYHHHQKVYTLGIYVSLMTLIIGVFGLYITRVIIDNLIKNHLLHNSLEEIKDANTEIQAQRDILLDQKEKIEHQNKEIKDSIHYALRIQTAILPPDYYVKKCLPDSFIFYSPKDVVSGDFYFVDTVGDHVIFSAVDCTGHGVPGAMMSVIGFNLLNQAVKLNRLIKPSEILGFLDDGVSRTLRQTFRESQVDDGMDLALCSLNMKTGELQYAGAYNSLVYIKGGELVEVKADKFPIGVNYEGVADNYTNHTVQLSKGDMVYLYSDGYADQFGGPKNKKFKYAPLNALLFENHTRPMAEQFYIIKKIITEWKGENEQTDDQIVMGIRI